MMKGYIFGPLFVVRAQKHMAINCEMCELTSYFSLEIMIEILFPIETRKSCS